MLNPNFSLEKFVQRKALCLRQHSVSFIVHRFRSGIGFGFGFRSLSSPTQPFDIRRMSPNDT